MSAHMLTTVDNPFNPFTQFDEWLAYDTVSGYHTLGFLARIVVTSPYISESEQEAAIEVAIDEIVRENVLGLWRKVSDPSGDPAGLERVQEEVSSDT